MGVRAPCFTFSPSYLGTSSSCLFAFLLGCRSCCDFVKYPGFLHGFCQWPIRAFSFSRPQTPKLGSVATNRFVYRKTSGWAGWVLACSLRRPPLGFVHGFWILHSKIYQPFVGKLRFPNLDSSLLLRCFVPISLFTFHDFVTCFKICFIVAAVTRSCLVSKLRFLWNSCDFKFPLYHSHVHADHFNYFIPRSLGSQSFVIV